MSTKTIKYALAALVAVGVTSAWAQEFGAGASTAAPAVAETASAQTFEQPPAGAIAADQKAVDEATAVEDQAAKSAKDELQDYAAEKGYIMGWDESLERILVVESYSFDVKNPEVSSDYIDKRKENMSALLLRAKAAIIKTIYSEMDAERVLTLPGNPIADQIKEENEQFEKQLRASEKQLARLGANLEEAKAEKGSVSTSEILASITAWFGKAEKENLAAQYDADKKELYASAKAAFEQAKEEHEAMIEKAKEIQGKLSSELTTTMSLVSSMQIHGCTVLQQAEQITERNGRYTCEMAVIYAWSNERMEASAAVLSGKTAKFKPGKLTITQWLMKKRDNKALAEWIGPRSYIDVNGDLWFLGIMPAATATRSSVEDRNLQSAELEARAETRFALYADAFTKQDLEKLRQTKDVLTADGLVDDTKVYKNYEEMTGERFSKVGVSGEQKLATYKMKDSTGQAINVVVVGVNASSARAMKDIQKKMHVMGLEINTQLEFERGRQDRMRAMTEASRDNPAARAAGARQADADVKAAIEAKRAAAGKATSSVVVKPAPSAPNQTKGKLKTGTRFSADDDE